MSLQRSMRPAGFFVLRVPRLPFDELASLGADLHCSRVGNAADPEVLEHVLSSDRSRLRQRLAALVERPDIREALFVASPSLGASLATWRTDPDSKRGRRIERALVRYVGRMAARVTPFGLFAGCAVGAIGSQTHFGWSTRKLQRRTYLDVEYLAAVADALAREPLIRQQLVVRPNSSLYRLPSSRRYVETHWDGTSCHRELARLEVDAPLELVLERARSGARLRELAESLRDSLEDVTIDEAESYVLELVEHQILCPDIEPRLTGTAPLAGLLKDLQGAAAAPAAVACLEEAGAELRRLDEEPVGSVGQYRAIAQRLGALAIPFDLSRLFHVDLHMHIDGLTLGESVVGELQQGIAVLQRISEPRTGGLLDRFRAAFHERYGQRDMPLGEVLDEETGLRFDTTDRPLAGTSLLEGLSFGAAENELFEWTASSRFLLGKVEGALLSGAREISLTPADIERLGVRQPSRLPPAFEALAVLEASGDDALSRGDFRLLIRGISGPPGARWLARLCGGDSRLSACVSRYLRQEEEQLPPGLAAEIVHLPDVQFADMSVRPVLRAFEIPFLGRSGAPLDRQITLDDLLVSVESGTVMLFSRQRGCRVLPLLTCAHDFSQPRYPLVYRFLASLQGQGCSAGAWSWGPLESFSFLPRVSMGRIIFALARWRVTQDEMQAWQIANEAARFAAVQRWRTRRGLPHWAALADHDNRLPIDFDNVLSVDGLLHLTKQRSSFVLEEIFPAPEQLCVSGGEGRFVHELVVPFIRIDEDREKAATRSLSSDRRVFAPGSEWLFYQIYCGEAAADGVLLDVLAPVIDEALRRGNVDAWFFLRYTDPHPHLRVRFHGEPRFLAHELLATLHKAIEKPLAEGTIWRVQVGTYEPETARYGGAEGLSLSENLFFADSGAVLACLGSVVRDERWRLAFLGADRMLLDLGLDLSARHDLSAGLYDRFVREFSAKGALERAIATRYRRARRELTALLEGHLLGADVADALEKRSNAIRPLGRRLRELESEGRLLSPVVTIAESYVHMHINRVIPSAPREHELVIYDFLRREYESRLARGA